MQTDEKIRITPELLYQLRWDAMRNGIQKYQRLPYPLNFWSTIYGYEVSFDDLPADWEDTIEHIFASLSHREKAGPKSRRGDMLQQYFKDKASFHEIARVYRLSPTTVITIVKETVLTVSYVYINIMQDGLSVHLSAENDGEMRLEETVIDLALSPRPENALIYHNITTISALIQRTDDELLDIRGMGEQSLNEIKAALATRGLTLRQSQPLNVSVQEITLDSPITVLAGSISDNKMRCFRRQNVNTVGALTRYSEKELRRFCSMGPKAIDRIKSVLAEYGLSLRNDPVAEIETLPLATRIKTVLIRNKITSIHKLSQCTEEYLLDCHGLGVQRVLAIKAALAERGLSLRPEDAE